MESGNDSPKKGEIRKAMSFQSELAWLCWCCVVLWVHRMEKRNVWWEELLLGAV